MKNFKSLSIQLIAFCILQCLLSLDAYAQHYLDLQVQNPGSNKVKVSIQPKNPLPVWVRVRDAAGVTLHQEYRRKGIYNGYINFSELKEGSYYVELTREDGIIRRALRKDDQGLHLLESEEYIYNFARLKDKRKLQVRCSSNFGHPLLLRLTDHAGKVLYEEKNITDSSHYSQLDLSNLPNGYYRLQLVSGTLQINKTIQLGGRKPSAVPEEKVIVTALE